MDRVKSLISDTIGEDKFREVIQELLPHALTSAMIEEFYKRIQNNNDYIAYKAKELLSK